jgi:hypothetical protein
MTTVGIVSYRPHRPKDEQFDGRSHDGFERPEFELRVDDVLNACVDGQPDRVARLSASMRASDYELSTDAERTVLDRLSVFVGGGPSTALRR